MTDLTPPPDLELGKQTTLVTVDDLLELIHHRLSKEVRITVERDLRWKYFWIAVIVAGISGTGITMIVGVLGQLT